MSVVKGSVSPGFEPVRDAFAEMVRSGCDTRAQLCVFAGEERVVDLWAAPASAAAASAASAASAAEVDEAFGPDSLVNVFSSTKSITAIVVAKMVDNGLLE